MFNLSMCCRGIRVTVACPGPAATGEDDKPRKVYNATGLVTKPSSNSKSKQRMKPSRVAELIGKAAYHRVHECWIAKHPVLALGTLAISRCADWSYACANPALISRGRTKAVVKSTCRPPGWQSL